MPRVPSDFDGVVSELRRLEGCRVELAADSPDEAVALCPDQEPDAGQGPVWIYLIRQEGFGISVLFSTLGLENLDALRRCPSSPFVNAERFSPASIIVRDRLSADGARTELTLINAGADTVSHLYSTTGFNSVAIGRAYEAAFLGVPPPTSTTTSVLLEGFDPLRTSGPAFVSALTRRGAKVIEERGGGSDEPMTCLSGGTSVTGAASTCVQQVLGHILSITYRIPSRKPFAAEVARISARLAKPLEETNGGCSLKWWTSGDMLARASYCDREGGNITYINTIVATQREMLRERYREGSGSR